MHIEQTGYAALERDLLSLFEAARKADELSFAAALLRLSAMGRVNWDPFDECGPLLDQCRNLACAPVQGSFQVRLLLLVYSHLVDLSDLHQVVIRMLRIVREAPFRPEHTAGSLPDDIAAHAAEAGYGHLAFIYREAVMWPVLEAFRRGHCSVLGGAVHIHAGEAFHINHVPTRVVPFDYLVPRIDLTLQTAEVVMRLTRRFRSDFSPGQKLDGRTGFDGATQAEALVDRGTGLVGLKPFSSPQAA